MCENGGFLLSESQMCKHTFYLLSIVATTLLKLGTFLNSIFL